MSQALWCMNLGDFTDFLEKEIAEGRNPTTPEEWAELMVRFHATGKAKLIGVVDDDIKSDFLAAELREEGLKVKRLKP